MGEISVVGLGLMGTALARAIRNRRHDLVVWNRSASKMLPFQRDGVRCAADLSIAMEASPVVLFCIDNYDSVQSLLDSPDAGARLNGKTIVQLGSGTPKEALQAAERLHARGADYLDGAILGGPDDIGTSKATILLSGDETAFSRAGPLLDCLGHGTVRYLGGNVRAASALDLAWLMSRYGSFLPAIHAAAMCRSEEVDIDEFVALVPDQPSLQRHATVIRDESYEDFSASLRVWGEALGKVRQQGREAGINTEIPDFIFRLFERAVKAGLGETHVMSLIKVLQSEYQAPWRTPAVGADRGE